MDGFLLLGNMSNKSLVFVETNEYILFIFEQIRIDIFIKNFTKNNICINNN